MKTIFITGTDTGAGKTLLTALLLAHLRQAGVNALAVKPFSSGSRSDARLLRALQRSELALDEINPFHFSRPLAPLMAARRPRDIVPLNRVLEHIAEVAKRCECLLVEGIGGLLVPLGRDYTVRDVIVGLECSVLIVSRNQIGTLNHTLLTAESLLRTDGGSSRFQRGRKALRVLLMDPPRPDLSSRSNARALGRLLAPVPLLRMPFLGPDCRTAAQIQYHAQRLKRLLDRLLN